MGYRKARIDDVVRLCGLSRSTVDRVLNQRPGVRADTVARVEAALRELDYAPSALRARSTARKVQIFTSGGQNAFFQELLAGLERATAQLVDGGKGFRIDEVDPYCATSITTALGSVADGIEAVITVGMDTPEVVDAINRLEARGVRVVTLVSDAPRSRRSAYIGQDNFAVGRTAGSLMSLLLPPGPAQVAVLIGHLEFRHHLDRRSGFAQALGLARAEIKVLQPDAYGTDSTENLAVVHQLLADAPNLAGVYLAGGGQQVVTRTLRREARGKFHVIAHEVTQESRAGLAEGSYSMVLAHDVAEIGRKAVAAAMSNGTSSPPKCAINIYVRDNLPAE